MHVAHPVSVRKLRPLTLTLLALPLVAGVAAAAECPADGSLDPAALEAAGARIGALHFERQNVFDTSIPEEDKALFRAANRLHRITRVETIERQLLVKPGDRYQQRLLEESARILRATEYIREAELSPLVCVDGVVDIEVRTRDVWSLNPGIAGGFKGGESSFGFDLEDSNLLGTGARIAFSRRTDSERSGNSLSYRHDHLFGPFVGLEAQVDDNSDGSGYALGVQRPFYALDTHRAWGFRVDHLTLAESLYRKGEEESEFRQRNRDLDVWWGHSLGLRHDRVWRFSYGLRDQQRDYLPSRDPELQGPEPENRHLTGPWVGVEFIRNEWAVLRNYDQIDIAEDALLGTRFAMRLGWADTVFGGDRDAWWTEGELSRGWRLPQRSLLRMAGSFGARSEDGETRNLVIGGDVRYYREISERRLFFAEFEAQYGHRLDLDNLAYLGAETGLRAYPLRWAGGDSFARISVEQRYFTDWYPWRLFRVGGALFADVGQVWGRNAFGEEAPGVLANVGIGLRLSNTRSAFARLIHIDIAVPLDSDPDLDRVEFVVEARRAF
jgi:outer membrane protein assembly factor BamA